jgi:hypothetical protein
MENICTIARTLLAELFCVSSSSSKVVVRDWVVSVGRKEGIDKNVAVPLSAFAMAAMDPVVPQEITAELTQILSNLVQGDNEIRQKYVSMA